MSGSVIFDARRERRGEAVIVAMSGELDIESSETARGVLQGSDARAPILVLDPRQLTFIDSSGLSLVVEERQRAQDQGHVFAIAVGGAPAIRRIFELAGLSEVLPLVECPEDVLSRSD